MKNSPNVRPNPRLAEAMFVAQTLGMLTPREKAAITIATLTGLRPRDVQPGLSSNDNASSSTMKSRTWYVSHAPSRPKTPWMLTYGVGGNRKREFFSSLQQASMRAAELRALSRANA